MNIKKIYSKSSSFYKKIKSNFFDNNAGQLADAIKKNNIYSEQDTRINCKLCQELLPTEIDFEKHCIGYKFCTKCNHINGIYQDSINFASHIYADAGGSNYSNFYIDKKYEERLHHIYTPKVNFLLDHIDLVKPTHYDFGCGLGHLVNAARCKGIDSFGGDVGELLIKAGNDSLEHFHNIRSLEVLDINTSLDYISTISKDVLSMMAVIEHISDLNSFFKNIRNASFKYFYYSVPLGGLSIFTETIFPNVYPRHLSGGHTHLFTEESLLLLNEKLGVTPIAEWRFGTDIQDLKRSFMVSLLQSKCSSITMQKFEDQFDSYSDDLQQVLDNANACSQIHVIAKKSL